MGGAGDDTLSASRGPDQLTGGGGADSFYFTSLPYNAGHVTDFAVGTDRLDLTTLFQGYNYTGADPVADGRVLLQADAAGGTRVFFDQDQPNTGEWPTLMTTLEHVSPDGLTWAQLGPLPPKLMSISGNFRPLVEGNSGTAVQPFVVTRSGPADQPATVHWAVEMLQPGGDPGARADDFAGGILPVGDLSFAAGETSKTINVLVNGDTTPELDEGYLVRLSNPTGATINPNAAVSSGDILNDDGPTGARFDFASTSVTHPEGNAGLTDFTFNITRSGPTDSGSVAQFYVPAGSPASASDFAGGTLPNGQVPFAPGETSRSFTIQVVGDTVQEGDETFQVVLGARTYGYQVGGAATGTIVNDDGVSPPPPPPSDGGQVLSASDAPGQTLTGGSGNDTLNAGHNADTLTGAGGGDAFVFRYLPWNAGHVTDFTVGTDRLDLAALFQASGYGGTNPVADGYVTLASDGVGGTRVYYDTDGPAAGAAIQYLITDLDHVPAGGLTWAQLTDGGGASGVVLTASDAPGQTLTGGAGADTLNAGHNDNALTGAAGADHFVMQYVPWNAGHVTDFTPGTDILDLRPIFQSASYAGSNPVADHVLEFRADGSGNTQVYFDPDGAGSNPQWPYLITTLDHVTPSQLGAGDWLFH